MQLLNPSPHLIHCLPNNIYCKSRERRRRGRREEDEKGEEQDEQKEEGEEKEKEEYGLSLAALRARNISSVRTSS